VLLPTRLPAGQKLIHTKWIYAIKYETQGNIIKRKAWLVALRNFDKCLVWTLMGRMPLWQRWMRYDLYLPY